MKTIEERFWSKVEKTDTCWNWTGSNVKGYGNFSVGRGKVSYSHRISYEMTYGPIPEGMQIDHKCHNTACVNPSHLQAVTGQKNAENRSGAQVNSKTGIRGVSWHKASRKYEATVIMRQKRYYVGLFRSLAEAEAAVIAKRNELFTNNLLDRRAA